MRAHGITVNNNTSGFVSSDDFHGTEVILEKL